jgi:hypothetical protein
MEREIVGRKAQIAKIKSLAASVQVFLTIERTIDIHYWITFYRQNFGL